MLFNLKCISFDVPDSPPSPEIIISGVMREKESVNVTCTAFAPCPRFPPRLHWNLEHSQSQTQRGEDRVLRTQIMTTLHLTDKNDGFNVTCVASYPAKSTFKVATQAETFNVSCKCFLFCIPSAKTFLPVHALTLGPCFPRWSQEHQSVRHTTRFSASW